MFNLFLLELLEPVSLHSISKYKVSILHCVEDKDQIAVLIARMFCFF